MTTADQDIARLMYEALKAIEPSGDFTGWENSQGELIGPQINAAISAYEAAHTVDLEKDA